MRALSRWHVWLGWIIGLPLLMWTLTGLLMVSRPIEEVRGEHLRRDAAPATLPANLAAELRLPGGMTAATEVTIRMVDDRPIVFVKDAAAIRRYDTQGSPLAPVSEADARSIVARQIVNGAAQTDVRFYPADAAPLDFRREVPAWRVALEDGTHVYVGQETGAIEAVRTPFWRLFDVAWGLHIMDLKGRSDTHHPILIAFAALAATGTLIGVVLLFRRRGRKR
ncbi:PepSY domain-containing protein [Porphyrobacter sp. GA68]|uniref:PepSY domain-containing protein n=1 Tax=Porphyrobacter sp. GA68 TaxID=2883480 RepID=UPI001D1892E1|nr:PepSY domain-containing protein [Porphyrobacter sp. GA68]